MVDWRYIDGSTGHVLPISIVPFYSGHLLVPITRYLPVRVCVAVRLLYFEVFPLLCRSVISSLPYSFHFVSVYYFCYLKREPAYLYYFSRVIVFFVVLLLSLPVMIGAWHLCWGNHERKVCVYST